MRKPCIICGLLLDGIQENETAICRKHLTEKFDAINPSHYTDGGIETIDYLRAKLSRDEFAGFLRGNVLKYVSRAGKKGDAKEDYKKAQWYLNRLIENE